MSDDPIERLRAHVEKHKHHQQAFFSTHGLKTLLEELDQLRLSMQDYHQMHDHEVDLRMDAEKKVAALEIEREHFKKIANDAAGERIAGMLNWKARATELEVQIAALRTDNAERILDAVHWHDKADKLEAQVKRLLLLKSEEITKALKEMTE